MIRGYSKEYNFEVVFEMLKIMIRRGVFFEVDVYKLFINSFVEKGELFDVKMVFDSMIENGYVFDLVVFRVVMESLFKDERV